MIKLPQGELLPEDRYENHYGYKWNKYHYVSPHNSLSFW